MDALGQFQASLTAIAERAASVRAMCASEESTKLYLVLPVITALGYDCTDPFVFQPEFAADFRKEATERVDFVILRDEKPIIAIECKKVGTDLAANRGQLRAYFTALQSVHLGILTDGIRFEFFVDCESPNIMDPEPFVTLDLEAATRDEIPADVLAALFLLHKANFAPEAVSELAEERLVAKRLRTILMQEVREPSDDFCRHILQRVGLKNLRRNSIQQRYSSLIRSAFEDAFVIPVVEKLRAAHVRPADTFTADDEATRRIVTTDRELSVYRYVCRRLAFLATDEAQFSAVERVQHRDYVGKFAVFYDSNRKGRLFDFVEGSNGYDKFVFPEPFGEIVTNTMKDIDEALRATFTRRLRELGTPSATQERVLESA